MHVALFMIVHRSLNAAGIAFDLHGDRARLCEFCKPSRECGLFGFSFGVCTAPRLGRDLCWNGVIAQSEAEIPVGS